MSSGSPDCTPGVIVPQRAVLAAAHLFGMLGGVRQVDPHLYWLPSRESDLLTAQQKEALTADVLRAISEGVEASGLIVGEINDPCAKPHAPRLRRRASEA